NLQITERTGAGDRMGVTTGTETVKIYNAFNQQISEEINDIVSGLTLNSWMATVTDSIGRPTKIVYNAEPDDYEEFQYGCCGLEQKRNRDASVDIYFRDHFKRVYLHQAKRFASDSSPLATSTIYEELSTTVSRGGL